eukprot:g1708.t1
MGNLVFSLDTVAHLIRLYDTSGSGEVSLADFRQLHSFLINVQQSYNYFDRDRSGTLTPDEVYQALLYSGFTTLSQQAFYALVKAFDPTRQGQLGLSEYIEMTLFIRSVTATFTALDTRSTGNITMDFDKFLYACANTR